MPAGAATDARHRPHLLLVVPVALAGADPRPVVLGHPLGLPARMTAALLSAGLAWLTLRYLENPLRFAPTIRNSPWRSLGLGAAATAIAVCVGVGLLNVVPTPVGHGTPATPVTFTAAPVPAGSGIAAYDTAVQQAFAQVQAAVAASADLNTVPSNLNPALAAPGPKKTPCCSTAACASLSKAASRNARWAIPPRQRRWRWSATRTPRCGLRRSSRSPTSGIGGWSCWPRGRARCWTCRSPTRSRRLVEQFEHCEQWRAEIVDRLHAERPRLVVLSLWRGYGTDESLTGYQAYDPAWIDGLTRLVRQLRDTGAQVLVLGPVPDPHFVVPVCLSGFLDDVAACTPARSAAVNDSGIAAEAAATKAGGGHYADLTDLFCTAERCPVIVGNTLVYLDENHMTLEYSRLLAPAIGALADRALAHN